MPLKNILFLLISFLFLNFLHTQEEHYKHQIKLGRSAYYFGDQPMKIGQNGLGINSGFWIYFPYLSYEYKSKKKLSFGLSFEEWSVSYYKYGKELPVAKKIQWRSFLQSQTFVGFTIYERKKVFVSGSLIGAYRFNTSEGGVHSRINQGSWTEGRTFSNDIKGFGGGCGIEIDYHFYTRFSIAVKGSYIRFSDKRGEISINYEEYGEYPKNQLGVTLVVGYSFGKQQKKKNN
jgi:outer membrane protease